jgi:DNA polymerase-3 subunit gamma/tau
LLIKEEILSHVLSIKYRPKNFEEVVGQGAISSTLSLALKTGRLSHAYLFSGLRGSGKTSTARIFSKALLCQEGPTPTPCEICANCKMANENRHIDILELDGASHRNIDDIRDIIEQSKYKPSIGKYKVFIIDEVHMLTKQAFNALLKTLEEPPEYVKFILATTDALKVPATILSRSQHFRFRSIPTNDISNHIASILKKENIKYEDEALEALARNGSGSQRDTLTILDQAIIYSKGNVTSRSVADMLGAVDKTFLDNMFASIFAKDTEAIKSGIKELESYEADTIIDEIVAYIKNKFLQNDDKFSIVLIDRFFRILGDSKYLLSLNSDNGFVLTLMFFKMLEALKVKDINDLIDEMEDIHKDTHYADNKSSSMQQPITEQTDTVVTIKSPQIESSVVSNAQIYDTLIVNISSKSSQIGECFSKSFKFASFENSILTIEDSASSECREKLRAGYSKIRMMIKESFGADTKIVFIKDDRLEERLEKKPEEQVQQIGTPTKEASSKPEFTDSTPFDTVVQKEEPEANSSDLSNNPLIKKAAQMLESQKVHITTLVEK